MPWDTIKNNLALLLNILSCNNVIKKKPICTIEEYATNLFKSLKKIHKIEQKIIENNVNDIINPQNIQE